MEGWGGKRGKKIACGDVRCGGKVTLSLWAWEREPGSPGAPGAGSWESSRVWVPRDGARGSSQTERGTSGGGAHSFPGKTAQGGGGGSRTASAGFPAARGGNPCSRTGQGCLCREGISRARAAEAKLSSSAPAPPPPPPPPTHPVALKALPQLHGEGGGRWWSSSKVCNPHQVSGFTRGSAGEGGERALQLPAGPRGSPAAPRAPGRPARPSPPRGPARDVRARARRGAGGAARRATSGTSRTSKSLGSRQPHPWRLSGCTGPHETGTWEGGLLISMNK